MTNKLKLEEIFEEFEVRYDNAPEGERNWHKKCVAKACIEYARSVVPEDSSFISTNPGMEAGYRKCINFIQGRISQDELSLGEEDTLNT